ncbi:TraR/DksA C4-type zinc finger protein [Bacillus xiapuensis]|uniref:TraR/DksA C4-type zinc finger protein n=1 Tax=Bacillus xiapuensis TaxID=2014075 RepID=UPI000C23AEB0|nr:TraR/DksA C4-type zinc finger protein [Bacillus xiapuensis]
MLTPEQLLAFESQLTQEKAEAEKRLQDNHHFDLERGHYHDSMGELSSYDNHPADEGTALYERGKDLALNEHEERALDDINKALEAIKNGTYGECAICGKDIAPERLKAVPSTLYCIDHTPNQEVSEDRPIEESILTPPFGKFDNDGRNESVMYDAEDAWQEVASFGTSETPSDFADPPEQYDDMYAESGENIGYAEDFENFVGVDIEGKHPTVYPNKQHDLYEEELDEAEMMTSFGDLPGYEHDPYVEETGGENG